MLVMFSRSGIPLVIQSWPVNGICLGRTASLSLLSYSNALQTSLAFYDCKPVGTKAHRCLPLHRAKCSHREEPRKVLCASIDQVLLSSLCYRKRRDEAARSLLPILECAVCSTLHSVKPLLIFQQATVAILVHCRRSQTLSMSTKPVLVRPQHPPPA